MIENDAGGASTINAGDRVRIINIPHWLLHDLPEEDQQRLKAHLGQVVTVLKLTPQGHLWLSHVDGTEGFNLQPTDVQPENR